jgi:hypothetical protein
VGYFDLSKIKYLIVHHTAENIIGPSFVDQPSDKIRNYYSGVGYTKGYEPYGYDKRTGYSSQFGMTCPLIDPVNGRHVFPMYHLSFRKFSNSISGWTGELLVKDPLKYNVNSLSGDWPEINKHAISIHFCGNFEKVDIDTNALFTAAVLMYEFYQEFKPEIKGHKDFDRTGCPGRIYDKLGVLKEFFENSDSVRKMARLRGMYSKRII